MELKNKFKKILSKDFTINDLEKISDEYAVCFAEWCDNNYFRMGNTNLWSVSTDFENNIKLTTNDLLLIFKKEKK